MVNLVNSTGSSSTSEDQKALGLRYQRLCQVYNVPFHWFDFHRECKRMPFDAPLDKLSRFLETNANMGFFLASLEGPRDMPLCKQNGVVRINCMDNLDRTTVVQCRVSLAPVLNQLEKWEGAQFNRTEFEAAWLRAWKKNADQISFAYTGVPNALKTDFYSQVGARETVRGRLQDALTSLTRYVQNNFFDGQRHDDLVSLVKGPVLRARNSAGKAMMLFRLGAGVATLTACCSQLPREYLSSLVLALCLVTIHTVRRGPSSRRISDIFVQRPTEWEQVF